jgi:hypothetical protein
MTKIWVSRAELQQMLREGLNTYPNIDDLTIDEPKSAAKQTDKTLSSTVKDPVEPSQNRKSPAMPPPGFAQHKIAANRRRKANAGSATKLYTPDEIESSKSKQSKPGSYRHLVDDLDEPKPGSYRHLVDDLDEPKPGSYHDPIDDIDIDIDEPKLIPIIKGGQIKRSKYVSNKRPKAVEPYRQEELRAGDDVESSEQLGFVDRLKNIIGGKKSNTTKQKQSMKVDSTAYSDAPEYWSLNKKRNFHKNRAEILQHTYDRYKNMARDAEVKGDLKKAIYAQKHAKTLYQALRGHREAFIKLRT